MTDTVPRRTVGKRGRLPVLPPEERFALKWADEYLKAALPTPSFPIDVSEGITDFGMMGNDVYGDCVEAGEVHYEMTTAKAAGAAGPLSTSPLAMQRAVQFAGFVAGDPPGPGTNMPTFIHKLFQAGLIKAWAPINPRNKGQAQAFVQAGFGVLIGVELYDTNEEQFGSGQPWDANGSPDPEDGHCVLWVGSETAAGPHTVITWGQKQATTDAWLEGACLNNENGELYLIVTTEEQLALFEAALVQDVAALGGGEGGNPNPAPPSPPPAPPVPPVPPVPPAPPVNPPETLAEYASQAQALLQSAQAAMQEVRVGLNHANTSPTLTPAQHTILATLDGPLRIEETDVRPFLTIPIPESSTDPDVEPEPVPDPEHHERRQHHWWRTNEDVANPPHNPYGD